MNTPHARFLPLLLLGGLLSARLAPTQSCAPPSHLAGWWRAENNPDDVQGLNPGALLGNTAYVSGAVGRAFAFDGNDDGVMVGSQASLQAQQFSIEGWLKRTSATLATLDPTSPLYAEGIVAAWGHLGWGFGIKPDGRLVVTKIDVSDALSNRVRVTDTSWHHVACSLANGTATFWVDGVAEAVPYQETFAFATFCALGVRPDTMINGFYGALDEVSIYGRALTAAEVQAIAQLGSGKCRALTADVIQLSTSSLGVQTFALDAGSANAGKGYLLLGTVSGTQPGLAFQGLRLPLDLDGYFMLTLSAANLPPLGNTLGILDANGKASASFTVVPRALAGLTGMTMHHAFVAFGAALSYASNPWPTTFVR